MKTMANKVIIVTGSAGFIGSNLVKGLLKTNEKINIIGFDSVNDYYELCGLEDKDSYELRNYGWTKDAVLNMSVVRIGPNYVIDVPRIVQCFQMKGENHA